MLLSNDYNSILSYFKNKLNPSEQTKILFQPATTVIKNDEKNLLMTHNAKSDNIDEISESGNLIAPSFAITKKDYEVDALSKLGLHSLENRKKLNLEVITSTIVIFIHPVCQDLNIN